MNSRSLPHRQRGVVLFLALIVLVAMLLSGIALFRTADSGILTAGNLALQKTAVNQGDRGIETASTWLAANAGTALLYEDPNEPGYVDTPFYIANALYDQPAPGQSWLAWWNGYTVTHTPDVLTVDPDTGHQVSYLIQRLCTANGSPSTANVKCARSPNIDLLKGQSRRHDMIPLEGSAAAMGAIYYRIIARIDGPRNTMAFVEAIVAL